MAFKHERIEDLDLESAFSSEERRWERIPSSNIGTLVKLTELQAAFPADKRFKSVVKGKQETDHLRPGFTRYSRPYQSNDYHARDVAYKCGSCEKLILGPPDVEAYDHIGALAGSAGLKYSCVKCKTELYEKDVKVS